MSASATQPLSILVVDDEDFVRETLSAMLEFQGHSVTIAASGAQALQLFQPGKFHIVFTDLSMPGMSGTRLATEIKSRSPRQPIVMVTTLAAQVAPGSPSIDFLIDKPFTIQHIQDAVAKVAPTL